MNIVEILGALEMGLIYGLVAVGVYLTSRVINFPDLTVDGSFPLGAAIAAALIVSGVNPWIATLLAFVGGVFAGSVTGYLNVRWNILGLLDSWSGFYNINRIGYLLFKYRSWFGSSCNRRKPKNLPCSGNLC